MSKPIEISVKIYHNTESFILLNWEEVHLDGSMAVNVFASLTMATLIFTLWKQRRVKNYQQLYVGKFFDYYNFSFPITWNIIKCVWYCVFFPSPGAIGSSLLAYILPCLFHLKLCHRDLPWLVCFKDTVIIILGILCSIVSLYSVIIQLAKNTSV